MLGGTYVVDLAGRSSSGHCIALGYIGLLRRPD